jgi:hypothetical protein
MTALAANKNVPELSQRLRPEFYDLVCEASQHIFVGSLVCVNTEGRAVVGSTSTTLIAVGVAEEEADNSAGADDAIRCRVKPGVFMFKNSTAGDAIAITERFKNVYIVDDQTVAKTDGTGSRSVAGKVVDVLASGDVYVSVDPLN